VSGVILVNKIRVGGLSMKKRYWNVCLLFLIVIVTLSACGADTTTTAPPKPEASPISKPTEPITQEEPSPTPDEPVEEETADDVLPPEPQHIEFQATDETVLQGTYYPSSEAGAPIVVLMHWARGDQTDWVGYALWMQNRGLLQEALPVPEIPQGVSLAVFTFDFRGFGGGGQPAFNPEGWLLDAQAAVETARSLPGVDPTLLATIGASIGSDGAVDACGEGCQGALSLSPGSYLGVPYAQGVESINAHPVWCLASEGDAESAPTCRSASGEQYRLIIYPGSAHGMDLLTPGFEPDTGQVILDFLELVFGL
jgi:dienelactone hydrolase